MNCLLYFTCRLAALFARMDEVKDNLPVFSGKFIVFSLQDATCLLHNCSFLFVISVTEVLALMLHHTGGWSELCSQVLALCL